jgi:hypothetical protein
MSFFSTLFSTAANVVQGVQAAETEIAAVVTPLVPGSASAVSSVEKATANVAALVTQGQKIVDEFEPEEADLETILDALFHTTRTPQGLLLTPKTTAATIPTS